LAISEFWQHAGENFQPQIFLVTQTVRPTLYNADFVVQPFDETERDLVLWFAVSSYSIPMSVDHLSEFLVGLEPLPLQTRAPVLEETARPDLAAVIPQLPKRALLNFKWVAGREG
jgi:hypothetical protein